MSNSGKYCVKKIRDGLKSDFREGVQCKSSWRRWHLSKDLNEMREQEKKITEGKWLRHREHLMQCHPSGSGLGIFEEEQLQRPVRLQQRKRGKIREAAGWYRASVAAGRIQILFWVRWAVIGGMWCTIQKDYSCCAVWRKHHVGNSLVRNYSHLG